jgi:hypothetical protein
MCLDSLPYPCVATAIAALALADLAKRLGSEGDARTALGKLDPLIALRSKERLTLDCVGYAFVDNATQARHRGGGRSTRRGAGAATEACNQGVKRDKP